MINDIFLSLRPLSLLKYSSIIYGYIIATGTVYTEGQDITFCTSVLIGTLLLLGSIFVSFFCASLLLFPLNFLQKMQMNTKLQRYLLLSL